MTYFLYFIFAAPILLETEFILKLWLGNVPEYSAIFTRLVIIHSVMMGVFAGMLYTINAASGNVRAYHTFGYVGYAAIIALSYYVCKIGYAPQYVFVVPLIIFPPCYIISVLIVKKQTGFPVRFFIKNAVVPILWVTAVSFIPFYFIKKIFGGTFSLLPIVIIITSMLWTGGAIMLIGLRGNERTKIIATVKRRVGMSG